MPLKIRCPHCQRVLVMTDELAGQSEVCPGCGELFNVPLPSSAVGARRVPRTAKCPHCGAEVSPTASFCHKCHRDLRTGRRLPLGRRLRLMPRHVWIVMGLAVGVAVVAGLAGYRLYRIHTQRAAPVYAPPTAEPAAAAELAAQLLGARSPAQRQATLESLSRIESQAAPAIAASLATSLNEPAADAQVQRNRIAAIDVLARSRDPGGGPPAQTLELLARCQRDPALREAALRARGLHGDARVLDEVAGLWMERLHRLSFLSRVAEVSRTDGLAGTRLALGGARDELDRLGDGLRALAQDERNPVFEHLADAWWESWGWLGQGRGDRFADGVFDLAAPPDSTLRFRPEDVRQPRDILKRVGERGTPAARAAAGLILESRGPQYKSVCRVIAEHLARLLPECAGLDQQRLTWTIARLQGKLFGNISQHSPLEVTDREIGAALAWAHPGEPPRVKGPYTPPPVITYRAVPARRLLERDLLDELRGGWAAVNSVADRWALGGLGVTPHLRDVLDPGLRRPSFPAVVTAMTIVAEAGDESLRATLELWREAADQPPWVRALAYTVIGVLDARRNRWDSGWPDGLDLGDPRLLDSGKPGWGHFGRILAAGGPVMERRLKSFRTPTLPVAVQAKLLEAPKRAADENPPAQNPEAGAGRE